MLEGWGDKGLDAQLKVVSKLAAKLEYDFNPDDLRRATIEAARITPPPSDSVFPYNPLTQFQPLYKRINYKQNEAFTRATNDGYRAIEIEPMSALNLHERGYF